MPVAEMDTPHRRASHSTADSRRAMADDVSQWWHDYKVDGDLDARARLAEHYLSLVRFQATKLAQSLPNSVDPDDLVSMGTFGLLDAIEKFDLERSIKFETYAVTRIVGAIWDQLRSDDRVPRSVRTKFRALEQAREQLDRELGRAPRDEELAECLGQPVEQVRHTLWLLSRSTLASLDDPHMNADSGPAMTLADRIPDTRVAPMGESVEAQETAAAVKRAIAELDERSRIVITLYYFEGLTLSEIGMVLEVTESRVCQLHNRAQDMLREKLGSQFALRRSYPARTA